jgi:hypothetical protein
MYVGAPVHSLKLPGAYNAVKTALLGWLEIFKY